MRNISPLKAILKRQIPVKFEFSMWNCFHYPRGNKHDRKIIGRISMNYAPIAVKFTGLQTAVTEIQSDQVLVINQRKLHNFRKRTTRPYFSIEFQELLLVLQTPRLLLSYSLTHGFRIYIKQKFLNSRW